MRHLESRQAPGVSGKCGLFRVTLSVVCDCQGTAELRAGWKHERMELSCRGEQPFFLWALQEICEGSLVGACGADEAMVGRE